MNAIVSTEHLRRFCALASKVTPIHTPKPILQMILLETITGEPEAIRAYATDLDVSLMGTLVATAEKPGSLVVSPAKLKQITDTTDDDRIAISSDDNHVHIKTSRSTFKLTCEDPTLFPAHGKHHETSCFIKYGDLKRAIARTLFAINTDSTRYALGGVQIQVKGYKAIFTGTDGRQLATTTAPLHEVPPYSTGEDAQIAAVIPPKALKLILGLKCDDDSMVLFNMSDNYFTCYGDDIHVWSRLVEGRFPSYDPILDIKGSIIGRLTVSAGELRRCLQAASVASTHESLAIKVDVGGDHCFAKGRSSAAGQSMVQVEGVYEGKPTSVSINPAYFLAALATMADGDTVHVDFTNNNKPVVITQDENTDTTYKHVTMPITEPQEASK